MRDVRFNGLSSSCAVQVPERDEGLTAAEVVTTLGHPIAAMPAG
jgi:hypothetical protein